ncbi:MAG: DUF2865 domain-containing protein [Salinarimonadaceae bacterium]|nr:MAG: DUF2865 domain-containing protein [Salinarimonadaceae bacterium]
MRGGEHEAAMKHHHLSRIALVLIGAFALIGESVAQSDQCRAYQAELANLERGGGRNYAALAEQQRVELNRMVRYYQQLDCDRGRALFNAPPSPECSAARERIGAMEQNYNRLIRQASQASEERRRALLRAIDQFCRPQQAQPRGLFDGLFGRSAPEPSPQVPREYPEERSYASKPVCVRTCDGYFFPLSTTGGSREAGNQICQAQCPAAPTRLFFIPGDNALESAVAADGTPYVSLPNAFRYRTTFDPSCSCRQEGQSWADALEGASNMIRAGSGDIVVSPEMARQMSRPQEGQTRTRSARSPAVAEAGETSGIRVDGLDSAPVLSRDQGMTEQSGGGQRRSVRVVAPDLIPPTNPM